MFFTYLWLNQTNSVVEFPSRIVISNCGVFYWANFLSDSKDIALVKNNALVGAKIAVCLAQMGEDDRRGEFLSFFFVC